MVFRQFSTVDRGTRYCKIRSQKSSYIYIYIYWKLQYRNCIYTHTIHKFVIVLFIRCPESTFSPRSSSPEVLKLSVTTPRKKKKKLKIGHRLSVGHVIVLKIIFLRKFIKINTVVSVRSGISTQINFFFFWRVDDIRSEHSEFIIRPV